MTKRRNEHSAVSTLLIGKFVADGVQLAAVDPSSKMLKMQTGEFLVCFLRQHKLNEHPHRVLVAHAGSPRIESALATEDGFTYAPQKLAAITRSALREFSNDAVRVRTLAIVNHDGSRTTHRAKITFDKDKWALVGFEGAEPVDPISEQVLLRWSARTKGELTPVTILEWTRENTIEAKTTVERLVSILRSLKKQVRSAPEPQSLPKTVAVHKPMTATTTAPRDVQASLDLPTSRRRSERCAIKLLQAAESIPDDQKSMLSGELFRSAFLRTSQRQPWRISRQLIESGWTFERMLEHDPNEGREHAFLAVAQHELLNEILDGSGSLQAFTDALTARQEAFAVRVNDPYKGYVQTTVDLVECWVEQKLVRRDPSVLITQSFTNAPETKQRLESLLQHAPWLTFLRRDHNGMRPILSFAETVQAMAITKPHLRFIGRGIEEIGAELYTYRVVISDAEDLAPDVIKSALMAASRYQTSGGPSAIAEQNLPANVEHALEQALQVFPKYDEGTLGDLAIFSYRQDEQTQDGDQEEDIRYFLVNTNRKQNVSISTDGGLTRKLTQFVTHPGHQRTINYSTDVREGRSGKIVLRSATGASISIELPRSSGDLVRSGSAGDDVDPRWFRGRADELAKIRFTSINCPPSLRQPIVVHGNRRAGKTTLARHVLREGVERGELAAFLQVDLYVPGGLESDNPVREMTFDLRDAIVRTLEKQGLAVPKIRDEITNPVTLLQAFDRAWEYELPFGLLFDEFDSLLYSDKYGPFYAIVCALGNMRFENIALLATVQRYGYEETVFKEWAEVRCAADLSWHDGVDYFTVALADVLSHGSAQTPSAVAVNAATVPPSVFARCIEPELGLRPYFWGQLLGELERSVRQVGSMIFNDDEVQRAIEIVCRRDSYLSELTMPPDPDLPEVQRKTRDRLSLRELAAFAKFSELDAEGTLALSSFEDHWALDQLKERELVVTDNQRARIPVKAIQRRLIERRSELEDFLPK